MVNIGRLKLHALRFVLILEELPWVSIIIADSGLGVLDESGLEACDKLIRKLRTSLARKRSQLDNLTDVLKGL